MESRMQKLKKAEIEYRKVAKQAVATAQQLIEKRLNEEAINMPVSR
jgi:hypothetical protein